MSDVVERLRTAIRHRNLYKEHILCVAADEIERLRSEIERLRSEIANDVIFKALRERIEELEGRLKSLTVDNPYQVIPKAKIDAAWRVATDVASRRTEMNRLAPLAELGIKRCEGCGGVGHWEQEPQTGGAYPNQKPTCSDCDGHGWVKI